jgi:class 3 adenylate cyclase
VVSTVVTVRTPGRQPIALLLEERVDLGRDCDGLLVPDSRMSRRHVSLEPTADGTVLVNDLGSSNGTTVDGQPVLYPTPVSGGAIVRAGNTQIVIGQPRELRSGHIAGAADRTSQATSIDLVAEQVIEDIRPELVGIRDEPGTLTIVVTDIEGSTDLTVKVGDQTWFEIVQDHQRLVADRVNAAGGRVLQFRGDGFMLCFRSARQALLCAMTLQRDVEARAREAPERAFRIRIGVHTGEVLVDDAGEFIGQHVVMAARIGDFAEGDEILLSSLVQQIAAPRGDLLFVEPREVALKGLKGTHLLYALDWRGYEGTRP